MPQEKDILNALFAAASGDGPEHDRLGRSPSLSPTPLAPTGWPAFLALLAEATHATSAALLFERQGRIVLAQQHGPALALLDARHKMRNNRVYDQDNLPGHNAPRPFGSARSATASRKYIRALKCTTGPSETVLLVLQRPGEDFRALDGLQLSALTPYLGPALSLWRRLDQERQQARFWRDMAHDLGAGWILFSPGGLVQDMDPALRDPLRELARIRIDADGRMSFDDSGTARAMRQAFAQFQAAPAGAPAGGPAGAPPRLLRLCRDPLMEIALSPLQNGGLLPGQDRHVERHVLGKLRCIPRAGALPLARTASHLGLNPSEARLATLICDGASLQQAAEQLGWTLETTRSTSKKIYARTGLSGQTALLRQMLGGALLMAGE